jgi:hypothetical protein
MKTSSVVAYSLLVSLLAVLSCKTQNDTNPCTYPHRVTIDSNCYAGNGVKLTASDYGDSPSSFEWTIIAVKDTSRVLGWTPKDVKIAMIAADTFTVPDSLASTYPRLIVTVATNCGGLLKHSIGYGFIRGKSAAGNCTVWTSQAN